MQYTNLGRTGLKVSRLCLGTMNFGPLTSEADSFVIMDKALELGLNFFDTANVYGWRKGEGVTEQIIGRWFAQGSGRREKIVLATKVYGEMGDGPNDRRLSAYHIRHACDESLRRMQTDHIDLYQLHRPSLTIPVDETLRACDDLIRAGKVRYIGHSNRAGWQIAEAEYVARARGGARFISSQNHYNLLDRRAELEVTPAAEAYGLGVLPYFPLANGLLTGKYSAGQAPEGSRLSHTRTNLVHDADWEQLGAFGKFAADRGLTEVQVAFSWLAAQPSVSSVIAGATTPEQVRQNAAAVAWKPSHADLAELDDLFPRTPKVALF